MALIQKAFSDIITFSRTSNATRVGPTGVLEYAPHNLLLQSQTFDNASWSKTNATVTANAIAAPDGTVTADKIINDSGVSGQATQAVSKAAIAITYTISAYAKAGEWSWFQIAAYDLSADGSRFWFNISTGAVGSTSSIGAGFTNISSSITSVGNGWYRCQCTFTTTTTTSIGTYLYPTNGNLTSTLGDGTSGIYLWGAQLAVGPYALDYVPTTSAAVYGPRFDYDGSGVTIVEPVSRNLVLYSQEFENAAWTKNTTGSGVLPTVIANVAAAPDGTITADQITINRSASTGESYFAQSVTAPSTNVYSGSIYLKAATNADIGKQICFWQFDGVSVLNISFATLTSDWQRHTPTPTSSISSGANKEMLTFGYLTSSFGGGTQTGSVSFLAWGAQAELGSTATAYMVSGASNGFRAVPVVSGSATPKGLLVEEQRQNLLPASNDFSNVTYWTGGGSVTANATTSPDGTVNAAIGASINPASGVGDATVAISGSIFAKANPSGASSLVVRINRFGSGTDYLQVTFNLSTGVAGSVTNSGTASGGSASMTAFGNGWYRCVLSGTVSTTAGTLSFNPQSTCFIYGAQLEAGSFATSLIPTLASAVTRTADVASVNTLSPWYNQSAGTFYAEIDTAAPTVAAKYVIEVGDGSGTNRTILYISNVALTNGFIASGGVVQTTINNSNVISANTTVKQALAYELNNVGLVTNGGTVATDTSATIPTVTTLRLGASLPATDEQLNGHLRRVAYYPRRLTNAELQALTA